jgi:hypothetical protein
VRGGHGRCGRFTARTHCIALAGPVALKLRTNCYFRTFVASCSAEKPQPLRKNAKAGLHEEGAGITMRA